ncbi:Alpha/Beta hydrolase protein [Aspergillus alliaceus]|uniref:Alpha/Beta hydrolase protein n=1 Tax=Petromyces alliaceus TaxID=209559 RepID=A0A5N7CCB5_PETAA|nr:Alpha/Beta hydrolase protein [Aspergillus alliaceus]
MACCCRSSEIGGEILFPSLVRVRDIAPRDRKPRIHTQVFGFTAHPPEKQAPIVRVEFTAIRGPHGTVPIRILYPPQNTSGGYSVGTVDEFENGCQYRLAPEWRYPTPLDEYESRGVDRDRVFGGGDRAGSNMTATLALPFATEAARENISGPSLNCNGLSTFAANYVPSAVPPSHRCIAPGQRPASALKDRPPIAIYTCGFDCLLDMGVDFMSLLEAGNTVIWHNHETLCHGFLQMSPWSRAAMRALSDVANDLRQLS